MTRYRELVPVTTTLGEFEEIEERIKKAFRDIVYLPLLDMLAKPHTKLRVTNAKSDYPSLLAQLKANQIHFDQGLFRGNFTAATSRELKELGATWDKKKATWRIASGQLPDEVKTAISTADAKFQKTLGAIDRKLSKVLPAEIAEVIQTKELFDQSLWKVTRELAKTLKSISTLPDLTPEAAARVSAEWQENLSKWIKDFAAEEITQLRSEIRESVFSGDRTAAIVDTIQKSYGVSRRKAKFLARQETHLLLSKFKEVRYVEAGVEEYKWRCVAGTKQNPVRRSHKVLDGKIFRWDSPPVTTSPEEPVRRNHPGEDFNCRCTAVPVVRF